MASALIQTDPPFQIYHQEREHRGPFQGGPAAGELLDEQSHQHCRVKEIVARPAATVVRYELQTFHEKGWLDSIPRSCRLELACSFRISEHSPMAAAELALARGFPSQAGLSIGVVAVVVAGAADVVEAAAP